MASDNKTSPATPPAWTCEPPERPWAGDWRLEDGRLEREIELDYERSRSIWEEDR
jgi:hypothetical protein